MKLAHEGSACRGAVEAEPPIVYVVDADSDIRHSLAELVGSSGYRARVAASAREFLALPRASTASCLIVEEHLPDLPGLELQRQLRAHPEVPIIFTTRAVRVEATVQAMKAGAIEFFAKPLVPEAVMHTVNLAINCSRAVLHRQRHLQSLRLRYQSLSRREREVMQLVVAGRLNKQVGGDLGITEITVKVHRGKIMRKMQAGTIGELINMAISLRDSEHSEFSA
jgi:FixJ family two-component response regulator